MVVRCSHREGVESVAYQAIEGRSEESGDLRPLPQLSQVFYQDKDLHVEPVADDLPA